MALFRIAEGRGLRFGTTGDEIDVLPNTTGNFDVDDIPVRQNGNVFVFDFSGKGSIGGAGLGDVRVVLSGRRIDELEIFDTRGRLLAEVGDFSINGSIESLFPLNRSSDRIFGAERADFIDAGLGDDRAVGAGGDDRLIGGRGSDSLFGGIGNDRLTGSGGADVLNGGGGDDVLRAGGGKDRLFGKRGDDDLDGGGKNDFLRGGAGDDTLKGGRGADKLLAGGGDDVNIGGGGADVFIFGAANGTDVIADFQQGLDRIRIKFGAEEFDDLSIVQDGADVVIRYAQTVIRAEEQNSDAFTADDFLF